MHLRSSDPVGKSAAPLMYTAWAAPGGTLESKITMLTCGWVSMLREWRACGRDTQKNSR
jgi:hypothetical protein